MLCLWCNLSRSCSKFHAAVCRGHSYSNAIWNLGGKVTKNLRSMYREPGIAKPTSDAAAFDAFSLFVTVFK